MKGPEREPLLEWLAVAGHPAVGLVPLAGDVSQRRYYRVFGEGGATSILAAYPSEIFEVCHRFARTGRLLERAGVRVPRIRLNDCTRGRMLLEDVGSRTLYDLREEGWTVLAPWIERAAAMVEAIGRIPAAAVSGLSPPLDGALLTHELEQTWRLVLDPRELAGSASDRDRLRSVLTGLCQRLGDAEPSVCHRDFMARNLLPGDDGQLALIDHQDLRLGPTAYDLASLLNDSLFAPPEIEETLLDRFTETAEQRDDYRRCVVQRTLKAVGTFAMFADRGSPRHLPLIPPALARAAQNLARLPEGRTLPTNLLASWRALAPPA